jgi:hypothetical protein
MAKFKFIKDFKVTAYQLQDGKPYTPIDKIFKKGEVIEGGSYPYGGENIAESTSIATTLGGKMPNWNDGDEFLCEIPLDVLEEVSADTPTDDTNDKGGFSVNQRLMIWVGLLGIGYLIYKNQ